eukprot:CAMPEP_0115366222 /NCGR_PEP_ID=MMETSP0270-20121206/104690_1 /TAXON_ID=71861 /ORGANISM="Scrippsiella trochoidea, Strain CCMP3099" /LENGTH=79 /DNA_ID=CAMNT_0002788979 /DNA_START=107 /DNA_END=346 /DNA_ORIENTATION=+
MPVLQVSQVIEVVLDSKIEILGRTPCEGIPGGRDDVARRLHARELEVRELVEVALSNYQFGFPEHFHEILGGSFRRRPH